MKPVHWAMIAAAAYLYYITSQRKNVSIVPNLPTFDPGSGPMTGPGAWDETGFTPPKFPHTPTPAGDETVFTYPKFQHTPTPAWAYSTMGGYEGGMNWPARDNIFG
jgi:hypothetical protein